MLSIVAGSMAQTESTGLRGIAVVPVMFRQPARPGATLTLPFGVTNLEPTSLKIKLEIHPVTYQEWTYGPVLGTPTKFDCSTWFAETSVNGTVSPRAQRVFPLKLTVPRGIDSGTYYCLATIVPNIEGDNSVIVTQYQIPVILYVGTQPRADLKLGSPELIASAKNNYVDVPFLNESDAFLVVGATVQVRNTSTGRTVAVRSDSDRNLYPETHRKLRFSVPVLGDGQYRVQAICQSGTRTFRPITADFVVKDHVSTPLTEKSLLSLPPFGMDPERVHANVPAGASRTIPIRITNISDKDLTISLTAHKLAQQPNGALQVLDDGAAPPLSIELSPDSITLEPKRTKTIHVKVSLDDQATGDNWFAISAITTAGDSMSEDVYGSVTVPESPKAKFLTKLSIAQKEIGTVNGYPISVDYEVTNEGNIALKPLPSAHVLENGLTPVASLEVPDLGDGGILPGATLHNRVMLPLTLKPGAYAVEVSYQYAEDLFEKKLIPFTVPAPKKTRGSSSGKKPGGKL
ncbi:MAG: hypothetical protein P4L46_15795 [Fimbriimonas sp.]|nr:hypothetical protein [Fimbriimonas sp.]